MLFGELVWFVPVGDLLNTRAREVRGLLMKAKTPLLLPPAFWETMIGDTTSPALLVYRKEHYDYYSINLLHSTSTIDFLEIDDQ